MTTNLTVPVVINRCFGGFGLSKEAAIEIAKRKNIAIDFYYRAAFERDSGRALEQIVPRNDPVLIDVVRTMGEAANGESAKLEVVEVAITIEIDNYDGRESVRVFGGCAYT